MYRRVVFLLAPSGAEGVLGGLAALPGVAARPQGTAMFALGLSRIAGNYLAGRGVMPNGGIAALIGDDGIVAALRMLADQPLLQLASDTGAEFVVEWTPEHADSADLITTVYPDAMVLDRTRVAAIERDPVTELERVCRELGLAASNTDIARAAEAVRNHELPPSVPPATTPTFIGHTGPYPGRLLMVLGAERSGTTWLVNLLRSHPKVAGIDVETWLFVALTDVWTNYDRKAGPSLSHWLDDVGLATAIRGFCDFVLADHHARCASDASWFVEKSPQHGLMLPRIATVYPDAMFVHIIRDGRDVARSQAEIDVREIDIVEGARNWVRTVSAVRSFAPKLAHFHEIRYEEAFVDPQQAARGVFEAMGLEVNAEVQAAVAARAGIRVSQLGTKGPVGPGKWKTAMTTKELRDVHRVAGDLLVELGYASRMDVTPRRLLARRSRGGRRS